MKIVAAAAVLACVIPAHGFAQEPVRMPAQEADQIRRSVIGYLWARPREQDRDCPPGGWCFSGGPDLSGFGALVGGATGAVVGAVVDALIPSSREVYRRPIETRLAVFPVVNRATRGVVVSVGW